MTLPHQDVIAALPVESRRLYDRLCDAWLEHIEWKMKNGSSVPLDHALKGDVAALTLFQERCLYSLTEAVKGLTARGN